jgi:hypothetical protein
VGEKEYWNVVTVDRARRAIVSNRLLEDAGVAPPYDVAFRADLARRAEVRLNSQIGATVSVEEALAFIDNYERLIESLIDSNADAGDPLPPPPGHPPDVRTGIPEVDAVIDAVLAGDEDTLRGLLRYEGHPCVSDREDFAPPPACPPGAEEGTHISLRLDLGCHAMQRWEVWADDEEVWVLLDRASDTRLYLVSEFTEEMMLSDWVTSDYFIMWTTRISADYVIGQGLHLRDGGIVSIVSGCGHPIDSYIETFNVSGPYLVPPPD